MKTLWVMLALLLFPCVAFGFDLAQFSHTPPAFQAQGAVDQKLVLTISATGIRRARVLVAAAAGYKTFEMVREGDLLKVPLRFEDLALLRYQFQIESLDGKFYETDFYTIRQPSSSELEGMIETLSLREKELSAQVQQLRSVLFSVKKADPAILKKRRAKELGRALLLLGKRERQAKEALEESDRALSEYSNKLEQSERWHAAQAGREFLEQISEWAWSNYAVR